MDNKAKSLEGMKKKEEKEKSWQGEKVAEFQKEQAELGEAVETEKYESSDDDEAYYEKEVGSKPERDLFHGSEKGKAFTGGKRFKRRDKSGGREEKGDKKFGGRGKDRGDKKKRERKVFNSDGVGPNFKKGGAGHLRGVKGGKVGKNKIKKR